MGQMAEDITDGTGCSLCGNYFQGDECDELYSHGYPVICWECWEDLPSQQRKNYQKALKPTVGCEGGSI